MYIAAVFLTYLALGTGLLAVGRSLTHTHLPSRLAASLAVFLGLWMLKDVLVPELGPALSGTG